MSRAGALGTGGPPLSLGRAGSLVGAGEGGHNHHILIQTCVAGVKIKNVFRCCIIILIRNPRTRQCFVLPHVFREGVGEKS